MDHSIKNVVRWLRPFCPGCLRSLPWFGLDALGNGKCKRCGIRVKLRDGWHIWPVRVALCVILSIGEYYLLQAHFSSEYSQLSKRYQVIMNTINIMVLFFVVNCLTMRYEAISPEQ